MKERIGDRQRVVHILEAIDEIERYVAGMSIEDFHSNSMARFASIKQLEIIGLRNILVHEYFGIDTNLIWQIISTDLPIFKSNISKMLSML